MNETPLSLLERLRCRPDEQSWRRLVDLYTPLIQRWLSQFGVVSNDVDDIQQEVLGTLVRELCNFEHSGRRGAFRSWVRTIAINRLRTYWRGRQNGTERERDLDSLTDPNSSLSHQWDREHDRYVVRRLMDLIEPDFSPNTWRSFRRQVIDGARPSEVADELGLSTNAVLIAKSRVLRRLRDECRDLIDDEQAGWI